MTKEEKEQAERARLEAARIAAFTAVCGPDFTVQPAPTFAQREDLLVAWAAAGASQPKIRRLFGAAIGLCYPEIARKAGADYEESLNLIGFGSQVYEYLRARGVAVEHISIVANALHLVCVGARAPRETEVQKKADFSVPPAVTSTDGR